MRKEIKNEIVPGLRFLEFKESGEWAVELLREVYTFKTTNSFSRDNLNYNEGEVKNIHYGDIHTKFATLFDITKERVPFINSSISINRISRECYCLEGDVIFADASEDMKDIAKSIELINLNDEKLLSGLHTLLARQTKSKLRIGFAGHLFMSDGIKTQIQREAQGSKVLSISATRLSNIKIYYPKNKIEQQKIADCLSCLDELITAQNQKLDVLKVHKKGLMQQLFPAEGETVPELRFAEFMDSGDWELLPIGSKVDSISGYSFTGLEISEDNSGVQLMRGVNITEGFVRHNSNINRYFTGDTTKLEKYIVCTSDLVIAMDGSKVGKNSALITKNDAGTLLVQRVARLRSEQRGMIQYIFQHIHSIKFHSYVDRINTSSGIPHISLKQIEEFPVCFPPTSEEQLKIADFLSSLDELIRAQKDKVAALQTHKIGLMQQMFPTINESNL